MTAFRGHGFSLLAPARGMPALPAKGDFSRPSSLLLPAGSSDTCYSRKCFRWDEQCAVLGVNGPPLQTTIVIAKARYTELLPNTMLAKEIHEDSLKKKTAFSACDVFQRSFPCPAGKRRR